MPRLRASRCGAKPSGPCRGGQTLSEQQLHPIAPHHLPFYLAPGSGTDVLMVVMGVFLIATMLWVGTLYWRLHSLPERMAHKSQKLQFEIVAGVGLIFVFSPQPSLLGGGGLLGPVDPAPF